MFSHFYAISKCMHEQSLILFWYYSKVWTAAPFAFNFIFFLYFMDQFHFTKSNILLCGPTCASHFRKCSNLIFVFKINMWFGWTRHALLLLLLLWILFFVLLLLSIHIEQNMMFVKQTDFLHFKFNNFFFSLGKWLPRMRKVGKRYHSRWMLMLYKFFSLPLPRYFPSLLHLFCFSECFPKKGKKKKRMNEHTLNIPNTLNRPKQINTK